MVKPKERKVAIGRHRDRIARLGYLTIDVEDLEASIDFYSRVVRLGVTDRQPGVAFMSGGKEHHWLRLEESPTPGVREVAFEVFDTALEKIRADLDAWGIPFSEGNDFKADFVDGCLRFKEPGGINILLYRTMGDLEKPVPSSGIKLEGLLHALWVVSNYDEALRFAQEVLRFKVSDMLEDSVAFLRCGNGYHHSYGFIRGTEALKEPRLGHFCVLVESLDDVMRFRNNALGMGVELELDMVHHPTSGSIGVYAREPWLGFSIEFCTGHAVISDEGYVPRTLPLGPESTDSWNVPLPSPPGANGTSFNDKMHLNTPFGGEVDTRGAQSRIVDR